MDDLELLIDLHLGGTRQGPGSESALRRALELAGLDPSRPLTIADIGCGTGSSATLLARELNAHVTALDFLPAFIRVLEQTVRESGLSGRVSPIVGSMAELPFRDEAFDVIWSEGAVYNIGFEAGVRDWRRYLKPGGMLAVSDLTWFTDERPPELHKHWTEAYPEVDTAESKTAVLKRHGYARKGYFPLPEDCWIENYCGPLQARFDAFLQRHENDKGARAIVEQEQREIALYEQYHEHYGYGFYVAQKIR